MLHELATNGPPPSPTDDRSDLSEMAFKIAAGLGLFVFLYLTVTGIESLGAGAIVPTFVSRAVALGVLLVGLGTAFANAYRGGRLAASVANPLAVAVGLSLFLVASDVFHLHAVEADVPIHFSVLFYLFVGGAVGLAFHVIGRGADRVVG